jgi:hypothetical protein
LHKKNIRSGQHLPRKQNQSLREPIFDQFEDPPVKKKVGNMFDSEANLRANKKA